MVGGRIGRTCRRTVAVVLLALALLGGVWCVPAHAAQGGDTGQDGMAAAVGIEQEYRDLIDALPEEVLDQLPPDMLPDADGETDFERVAESLADMSSFSSLAAAVGRVLSVEWGTAWRMLSRVMGLLLLSAVAGALHRSFRAEALSRAISLGIGCAMFAAVLTTLYAQLQKVAQFLTGLNTLIQALMPLMAALHVMGGNVAVAAVQNSTLMLFLALIENVCNRTVMPMTGICLALTLTAVLSPSVSLKGLTGFVKNTYTKTLGFLMLLLGFVMSAQTALRAASDSLTARAAKFLVGNMIPVLGGAVGDSLRTVAAGVSFLKSTVGVGAMIVLFLMVLPVLISLLLTRLAFRLCLGAAELLGCESEGKLLGELIGIYGTLIAVVAMCTVLLIYVLTLFVHVAVG